MKRSILLLALFASSAVFANDVDPFGFEKQTSVGGKTFAEVRAETLAAKQDGEIQYGEVIVAQSQPGSRSRQEVKNELNQARAAGDIHYGDAEI